MSDTKIKVRFCETDALGHINNTSYFIYLEEARIDFFEKMGVKMDSSKWAYLIASTKCDFIAQGYFNQTLAVSTYVTRIGHKSFTIGHEITDSKTGELIARGEAVLVHFDFELQKSVPLPDDVCAFLQNYLQTV